MAVSEAIEGKPAGGEWPSELVRHPRAAMWPAPPDLAPYITGVHLYVVGDVADDKPHRGAFEPAFASVRIPLVGAHDWRVRPSRGHWLRPPDAALFGPSSAVIWSESRAGILINLGLRPRGWLRLRYGSARSWVDRIGALPPRGGLTSSTILARLRAVSKDSDIPAEWFDIVRAMLGTASKYEPEAARIEAAIVDPAIGRVDQLVEATSMPLRRLQRLADRAFGFPPKVLLRRSRFLRSLHAMRDVKRGQAAKAIDPAYTDLSHFIRDAHEFLGMTPQAFLRKETRLFKRSLVLRKRAIGAPAQALDAVPGPDSA